MKCQICNKESKSIKGLACHVKKGHPDVNIKEYYDKYLLKTIDEKSCNVCGNEITFNNLVLGYLNNVKIKPYCSASCARKSEEVQEKQRKTCEQKYGDPNYRNWDSFRKTCLEIYGSENPLSKGTSAFDKRNNTVKEKYGVDNIFQTTEVKDKIRDVFEESGKWLKEEDSDEYWKYYKIVWRLTKKNYNQLYDNWDGYDYYDGEYIKDNIKLDQSHKNYPTIDHKFSVKYGFVNNIDAKIISDIENLCITKKTLNSSKRCLTEIIFKQKMVAK